MIAGLQKWTIKKFLRMERITYNRSNKSFFPFLIFFSFSQEKKTIK